MKTIKSVIALACIMGACCSASAQSVAAIDDKGQQVSRITFDRERVTIEYVNGEIRDNVDNALIYRGQVTAIDDVRTNGNETAGPRQVYDLQGRLVSDLNNLPQGIYIVREGDKVYKLIKK